MNIKLFLIFITRFVGINLILLNLSSIFFPLRNKEINLLEKYPKDFISPSSAIKLLNQKQLNSIETLRVVNDTINRTITHFGSPIRTEKIKYNLIAPIHENYILYALSFLHEKFQPWEIYNYRKAIIRGVGSCSQQAIIADQVLKRKNIPSKLIGLNGHVVLTAEVSKNLWWILDPDYGVILPFDIKEIEKNPSLITTFYLAKGYTQKQINLLRNIYGKDGNFIGEDWYAPKQRLLMYLYFITDYLKWFIPIVLIILSLKLNRLKKNNN